MDVVRRAVERIDDPDQIVVFWPARRRRLFLAKKRVVGKLSSNDALNGSLRRDVRIGHQIAHAFFTSLEAAAPRLKFVAARTGCGLTGLPPRLKLLWVVLFVAHSVDLSSIRIVPYSTANL